MANLFFTGFEGITTAQLARRFQSDGGFPIITATGRFGQGLQANTTSRMWINTTSSTTLFVGMAYKQSGFPVGFESIIFRQGGTRQAAINITNSGFVQAMNAAGTVVATSAAPLVPETWYYLEVGVVMDNSGSIIVRLNSIEIINVTGVDTQSGGSPGADNVRLQSDPFGFGTVVTFDDFYVNDATGAAPHNTFYGDVRVDRVDTVADDTVQFSPLSSTNESMIDDGNSPDDDTTYVSSSVAGHRDLYTVGGYATPSGSILGVTVRTVVRKTEAGDRTFKTVLNSGGTEISSSAVGLSTSYIEQSLYTAVDPNTGVAFTNAAAINAVKIGYEIVS